MNVQLVLSKNHVHWFPIHSWKFHEYPKELKCSEKIPVLTLFFFSILQKTRFFETHRKISHEKQFFFFLKPIQNSRNHSFSFFQPPKKLKRKKNKHIFSPHVYYIKLKKKPFGKNSNSSFRCWKTQKNLETAFFSKFS